MGGAGVVAAAFPGWGVRVAAAAGGGAHDAGGTGSGVDRGSGSKKAASRGSRWAAPKNGRCCAGWRSGSSMRPSSAGRRPICSPAYRMSVDAAYEVNRAPCAGGDARGSIAAASLHDGPMLASRACGRACASCVQRRNGRAPRSRSTASTTTPASRTSSGTHSVQPLAISVSTSVQTKLPAIDDPQCATRSASTKPGAGSCQSPNVRTGTLPRMRSPPERRRRR